MLSKTTLKYVLSTPQILPNHHNNQTSQSIPTFTGVKTALSWSKSVHPACLNFK